MVYDTRAVDSCAKCKVDTTLISRMCMYWSDTFKSGIIHTLCSMYWSVVGLGLRLVKKYLMVMQNAII